MDYFGNISGINELKLRYRRLALLNHPDIGGNPDKMAIINKEYNTAMNNLRNGNTFFDVNIGDMVIINGSASEVTNVDKLYFIARSLYSNRSASFYKASGICVSNPVFRATSLKHASKW